MNKLNNKGVTLVELIVSFAIVGVAIIYFFQTLYTVKTIYTTASNETNEFVIKDYGLRLANTYIDSKAYNGSDLTIYYNESKISEKEDTCNNKTKTELYKYIDNNFKLFNIYVCH